MGERSALLEGLRAYRLIAGMWVRSSMTYRTSFIVTVFGNLLVTGLHSYAGVS